jgi:hypothetical protein
VYKGGDRASAELHAQHVKHQDELQQPTRDETKMYVDGRYISAPEGK